MLYKYKYQDSLITFYCLILIIQLILECLVYSNKILEYKFSLDHCVICFQKGNGIRPPVRCKNGIGCDLFHLPVSTADLCDDSLLSFIKEYLYFGILTRFK